MIKKLQALFAPRDLTQGNPMKGIVLFAIPLLLGNLAQQMYNTVDAIVVGQYVGHVALGAIGATGPILNLMIVLFMGIGTGAGIVVSQYFGAKDRLALSRAVGTTIVLTFWSSLIMTVLGTLTARPLLQLLGTPEEMLHMASMYLVIIFGGITASAFYNILGGALRGLGDSVSPLLYLIVAALLNIVLDILFVTAFGMTTDGVAWATILSQAISALLCLGKLRRMTDVLDMGRKYLIVDRPIMRRIVALGVPAGVTQMIFSLSSLLVQSLTNSLGSYVVTANTAVMRVDGFAMMPNFTFGIAATTYTGQNVGARNIKRAQEGARCTLILALSVSTVLTLLILLFGEGLMRVFTQEEDIIQLGISMLQTLSLGYIAFGVTQTLTGVMRGAGEAVKPMWLSIITTVVIRMPIAFLWAHLSKSVEYPNGHPMSIYGSLLIAWIVGCLMTVAVFRRGTWKDKAGLTMIEETAREEMTDNIPREDA